VLKILQHDKIWGDNPPAPNSGGTCPPRPPVIYAHVHVEQYFTLNGSVNSSATDTPRVNGV